MTRTPIRFSFFGTPALSVEILETLKKSGYVPTVVVTNSDRPQGRNLKLSPPPVKVWAEREDLPILQPEKLDAEFVSRLAAYQLELAVVVAYGKILPKEVVEMPEKGTLNIHYSLLPRYRGATPIESQILNNERETGVTIMLMDEAMDHGPVLAQEKLPPTDMLPRASELREKMNAVAGSLLVNTLPRWIDGKIVARAQEHARATYTKKISKSDGEIRLEDDPFQNFQKIRAFEDTIGTYFFFGEGETADQTAPGQTRRIRVLIKDATFQDGKLVITRVLPEGKKEMSYEDFLRGLRA